MKQGWYTPCLLFDQNQQIGTSLTASEIVSLIQKTAIPIGEKIKFGRGLINSWKTLDLIQK